MRRNINKELRHFCSVAKKRSYEC